MKLGGDGTVMRLGTPNNPRVMRPTLIARRAPLPHRPDVVDDGVCFAVVWYPHRDAPTLVPDSRYRNVSIECRRNGW